MSIVSSYISSRAPVFKVNVQASIFLDHVLAIVAGFGVRIVIDVVGHENQRLTGSLVGLWEGVVVQHFIKKSPKSLDPFVAYAFRVFIDFLFNESLIRLVLTFLFTGMGIVLADIAPRVWVDTGLRRFWRHLRRDLYVFVHSVPSVPYFDRPRTVRFSPSQAPSIITTPPSPSIITATPQAPRLPLPRKRPVPGYFPDSMSETDTDSSVRSPGSGYSTFTGLTRDRLPTVQTESEPSYDPDEGNRSSSGSGTTTPILSEADLPNLPNIEDEYVPREILLEDHKIEDTPRAPPGNLPTPSDTTFPLRRHAAKPREVLPPPANLPHIPDDEEDWENISRREAQTTSPSLTTPADKSPSPLPVDPQVSSSGNQTTASTPRVVEPQPADNPLGDKQQLETPQLDTSPKRLSQTPVDRELETTGPKPSPAINNENDFDLLRDFNASPANPIAQTSGAQTPFGPQLAFDGSGALGSIWSSDPVATGSGVDWAMWGDVKDGQGGTGRNAPATGPKKHDDTPHDTAETSQRQDPSPTPETDASTPARTTESPTTKTPPDQDTPSRPSTTDQKDRDPTSVLRPKATTSQSKLGMVSDSNDPTGTGPSNNQQDLSPAVKEVAEQPSSTPKTKTSGNGNSQPITPGESNEAVTLTAPVIDEEPFPESNSERLDKALELRMEIVRIEKSLVTMKDKEEETLKSLKARAEKWYSIVSESSEPPSTQVDLSQLPATVFMTQAQTAIISCLLRNIRELVIITGPVTGKLGKARKNALAVRLDKLNLVNRGYLVGSKEVTITLPTSRS